MAYQAVADDSGCKGQGPIVVMAGMIGEAEVWADFADQWDACLHEAPKIRRFKMYEAMHRTGVFAGFSARARDKKLVALAKVMDRDDLEVLHITVDISEHDKAFVLSNPPLPRKKRFKAEGAQTNPYFYAYNSFISAACAHLWLRGIRDQFEFIVDEHPSLGNRMLDWYPVTRAAMQEPMRTIMPDLPAPRNDEEFLPLQAADLIAGLQRDANTPPIGSEFAWLNSHFTKLRQSEKCMYMGKDWFSRIVVSIADHKANGPPPTDALIQLARLQGAPIPAPGQPWPKKG